MALINIFLFHILLLHLSQVSIISGHSLYQEIEISIANQGHMDAILLSIKNINGRYSKENINQIRLISIAYRSITVDFFRLIYAVNQKNTDEVEMFAIFITQECEQREKVMRVSTAFKIENFIDITIHKRRFVSIQNMMLHYLNKNNGKKLNSINTILQYENDAVVHLEVDGEDKVYIIHSQNVLNEKIIEFL